MTSQTRGKLADNTALLFLWIFTSLALLTPLLLAADASAAVGDADYDPDAVAFWRLSMVVAAFMLAISLATTAVCAQLRRL